LALRLWDSPGVRGQIREPRKSAFVIFVIHALLFPKKAAEPVATPFPKHADSGFENVYVVLILVGKGRSQLFVFFFSDAEHASAIPDDQLAPAAKDPFVATKKFPDY
jgi:hypothetical protein